MNFHTGSKVLRPVQARAAGGRRGLALVLVMVLLAMSAILGLTYLTTASTKLASSNNLAVGGRAKYVAESGLQHALYVLQTDPALLDATSAGSPMGPYYPDNLQPNDSYSFYAVKDAVVPGLYTLTATSSAGGGHQSVTARVRRGGAKQFSVSQSLLIQASAVLPATLYIEGDVHSNGFLTNAARIKGTASAQSVTGTLTLIDAILPTWTHVAVPSVPTDSYNDYKLFGDPHAKVTEKVASLTSADQYANGNAVTDSNPGGVVVLQAFVGRPTLGAGLSFRGTIVVSGDLVVAGTNINLQAVDGYPALVVSGKIIMQNGAKLTVDGTVIAAGGIAPDPMQFHPASETTINGSLLSSGSGYASPLWGAHKLLYKPDRCSLYDFKNTTSDSYYGVEVLSWND